MMNIRSGRIALVLVLCAAGIGCVTYQYPPSYTGPVATEPVPAGGSDQPFYEDLAPYGRWVYVSGPGWVWSPHTVQAGWRPYQLGHWVFTDYGWTWASDEDWGWAVYHYGRWHLDAGHGWVWVPGTEWGPAWVAWHEGGGYVGWAPLPWQVRVQPGVGINWASVNVTISPSWWCFASARYIVDPGLRTHIVPQARNVSLIRVTQNVTNYTYIDNRIVNQGVRVEKIGRAAGHTIPRLRVSETEARDVARGGRVRGEDFIVFRPEPGRGRKTRGRPDPPGHEVRDRARDMRQPAEEAKDAVEPPATEQPPTVEPPARPDDQGQNNRGQQNRQNRGRKFMDDLMGKRPPHRAPQGTPPSQPPATSQPSGSTPQSPGTTAPADAPRTAPPGAPPARTEPAKPQTPQTARDKTKQARDAAAKGRKPKPDAAHPDEKQQDDPDSKKQGSEE